MSLFHLCFNSLILELNFFIPSVEKVSFHQTGRSIYEVCCRQLDVVPVSYFIRHINDANLRMAHHGVGILGAKAMAIPLVVSTNLHHHLLWYHRGQFPGLPVIIISIIIFLFKTTFKTLYTKTLRFNTTINAASWLALKISINFL